MASLLVPICCVLVSNELGVNEFVPNDIGKAVRLSY